MTFEVLESKLDMQCIITISNDFPIERFSKDYKLYIPATMIIGKEKIGLLYYLPEFAEERRDINIFLRSFGARKNNDNWNIYTNSKAFPQLNHFKEIVDIPSMVFDTMYLEDGVHHLFFRFHHNYVNEVSNVLLGPSAPESLSVEYLGNSRGINSVIDRIKDRQHVSFISVSTKPPAEETDKKRNPIQTRKWSRELKANFDKVNVHSIYYVEEKLADHHSDSIIEISREDGIYEARSENPLLAYLSQISADIPLPSIRRTQKYDGQSFVMNTIIPNLFKKDYINKIAKAITMFPEWGITLTRVEGLS